MWLKADTCTNANPCVDADSECFTDEEGEAQCVCSNAFTGAGCHVAVDFCARDDFCGVGGVCTPSLDDFECNCGLDFIGDSCDVSTNDCAGVTCLGGGVCVDGIGKNN